MVAETAALELDRSTVGEVVVVTVRGVLDVGTAPRLRDHLVEVGADQPGAVVVELADLDIPEPAVTAVFVAAHADLVRWPGVPLVLAVADDGAAEVVARQRLSRLVPVRRTVADAVAAVGAQPPRLVDRLLLPNSPASPEIARRFARDSCLLWGHPELGDDAAVVLGALVANTVTHTDSMARVRVELRRGLLSVAVYDDDPRPPPEDTAGGRGLALVDRTATAWGCVRTRWDGKVVWATLRLRDQ